MALVLAGLVLAMVVLVSSASVPTSNTTRGDKPQKGQGAKAGRQTDGAIKRDRRDPPAGQKWMARAKRAGGLPLTSAEEDGRHGRPLAATSHYLRTAGPARLRRLGCLEGRRIGRMGNAGDAIVILAFGRPTRQGSGLGASLWRDRFTSVEEIEHAARAYAMGYVGCSNSKSDARLQVALGTSNYGRRVTRAHGEAWAQMVNDANEWLESQLLDSKVAIVGATDIELAWNSPRVSRRWVRGYDSVARWPYYNFGDAAACAPRGNCLGPWTPEDLWFVSWGATTAWPLPQNYTGSGIMAEQWYRLSLYAFQRHGANMTIAGVLSQRAACRQSSDSCWGINNTPARAWRQLDRRLNRDRRTAQELRWVSDFRWEG